MQYDVMHKNPRILLGFRNTSDTFINIRDTGEFVINCPKYDTLDDMMETGRFYPEGANELDFTGYTMIPSRKVKPPSIAECPQIIECTVDQVYELDRTQGHVIGSMKAIVMDKGLAALPRAERLPAMNLPVGLGDEKRKYYFHTSTRDVVMHTLGDAPEIEVPPAADEARDDDDETETIGVGRPGPENARWRAQDPAEDGQGPGGRHAARPGRERGHRTAVRRTGA